MDPIRQTLLRVIGFKRNARQRGGPPPPVTWNFMRLEYVDEAIDEDPIFINFDPPLYALAQTKRGQLKVFRELVESADHVARVNEIGDTGIQFDVDQTLE